MNADWDVKLFRKLPEWFEPRVLGRDSFVLRGKLAECLNSPGLKLFAEPRNIRKFCHRIEARPSRNGSAVIDPETAQVRVRGGNYFRSDTLAYVSGSSSDSSIKPYGIYVGYAIEFSVNARRVRTSPVRDIRVLRESDRAA